MKSKAIIAAMSAAIILAGAAVFAVKTSTSSLFLANVEALADATPCLREDCAHDYYSKEKSFVTDCKTCTRLMNYDGENDARCWVH